MKAQAAEIATTTPEEFAAMLRNDFAKWSKVIKDGLRAEYDNRYRARSPSPLPREGQGASGLTARVVPPQLSSGGI